MLFNADSILSDIRSNSISSLDLYKERLAQAKDFQSIATLKRLTYGYTALAILPDGRIVSGSYDGLRIWDTSSYQCIATLQGHRNYVCAIVILPDGRIVSGSEDKTLRIWDAFSYQYIATLKRHTAPVNALALLSDGRIVSGCGGLGGEDRTLRIWDVSSRRCIATLQGHSSNVYALALLSDGRIVSGSRDKTLRIWDASTYQCISTLSGHTDSVSALAILLDGRIVSGSEDKTLRIWDASTYQCISTLSGHTGSVTALAVLPGGCIVSSSIDITLRIWDAFTYQCIATLHGHIYSVNALTVFSDGRIVSGSADGTLRIWDGGTPVLSLDDFDKIINSLKSNSSINSINFTHLNLNSSQIKAIADFITANNYITSLDLSNNPITDEAAQFLIKALYTNTSLRVLNLVRNNISTAVSKELDAFLLRNNEKYETLKNHLTDAIQEGDLALVQMLLRNKNLPLTINDEDETAYHLAVRHRQIEILRYLLTLLAPMQGVLNQCNKQGDAPIHLAVYTYQEDVSSNSTLSTADIYLRLLLQYGAAINLADGKGNTPLYLAAERNLDLAVLLAERGGAWSRKNVPTALNAVLNQRIAEAEAKHESAYQQLMISIRAKQVAVLDIAGNWLNQEQVKKLFEAIKQYPYPILCYLGEQAKQLAQDEQEYIQTMNAICMPAVQAADLCDINKLMALTQPDQPLAKQYGYTALHLAAIYGKEELVAPLAQAGVPIPQRDSQGKTPLKLAEEHKHKAFVRALKFQQEEAHLKRLLVETSAVQRDAQQFSDRYQALLADIRSLTSQPSHYPLLIQNIWVSLYLLQANHAAITKYLNDKLSFDPYALKLPAVLLRHCSYSFNERMALRVNSDNITNRHPMFKTLHETIKDIKQVQQKLPHNSETQTLHTALSQLQQSYERYITLVCQASQAERQGLYQTPVLLCGAGLAPSFLKEEPAKLLTPAFGQQSEKAEDQHGTAIVRQISNTHLKYNPHAPGVEYMVSSLGNILAGQGATPTELLKVIGVDGIPRIYQASRTVQGKELQSLILYYPDFLTKIKADNFSVMVILGLLTDPQDGKPDNYMVEFETDEIGVIQSIEILGIDNDIAFADPVIKKHLQGEREGQHFVNIKNVLYFFPQMQQPIATGFREEFLKRVPEVVLIDWLKMLYVKNQEYQSLLDQKIFTQEEFSGGKTSKRGLQLPIKLVPGTVTKLYRKLLTLYDALESNSNITHYALFELLEPEIAKHYTQVQATYKTDLMKSIRALYEESIANWEELKRFRKAVKAGETQRMTIQTLKTAEEYGFEDNRVELIENSIIEFLKVIEYKRFTEKTAPALYQGLQTFNHIFGQKPLLHVAAENKLYGLAGLILTYQLQPVDITNSQGLTAVHIAASIGDIKMLQLLNTKDAQLGKKDSLGRTALDKAKNRGHQAVVAWLQEMLEENAMPITPAAAVSGSTQATFFKAASSQRNTTPVGGSKGIGIGR